MIFDSISKYAHHRPNAWKQEKLSQTYLPIVSDLHLALKEESLCSQWRLATSECVHQELLDAGLEEVVKPFVSNMEGVG